MKIFFIILLLFSTPSFSWSLIDKLQYDSYKSCLSHKLKDVDTSKTNMNAAREAFQDDCKKAFCTSIYEVEKNTHESCLQNLKEKCQRPMTEPDYYYFCELKVPCPELLYKDKTCPGRPLSKK